MQNFKVALIGNPNCGKSSLFNQLTGLRQKVGNFHGVTVDKKSGIVSLSEDILLIFLVRIVFILHQLMNELWSEPLLAHKH